MPLERGPVGSAAFGRNVATEMKAGKPQKQAVAIAYNEAGEKKDCTMSDRLDSIMDSVSKMEARVDALCARKDADRYEADLKDNEPRVAVGVKGVKSTPWRKKFPNQAALDRFLDAEGDNYTIYSIERP